MLTATERDLPDGWRVGGREICNVSLYLEIPDLTEVRHRGHGEMKVAPITVTSFTISSADHADAEFSSIDARSLSLSVRDQASVRIGTLDTDGANLGVSAHADIYAGDVSILDLEAIATMARSS